jgi:hypothetical protein
MVGSVWWSRKPSSPPPSPTPFLWRKVVKLTRRNGGKHKYIRGMIWNIRDRICLGKLKNLKVSRSYLLLNTILHIVCCDSSDPCSAAVVSYSFVSPRRLEIFSLSGGTSAWARAEGQMWVRRMQNHWDTVLYHLAWRVVILQTEDTERPSIWPFPTKWIFKALQNVLVDGLILASGKKFEMHWTHRIRDSDWLSRGDVCILHSDSICFVVAINPCINRRNNVWQEGGFIFGTLLTRCCTGTVAETPYSRRSHRATRSTGMQHQKGGGNTLTRDGVTVPPAASVCGIRKCCQMCCMIMHFHIVSHTCFWWAFVGRRKGSENARLYKPVSKKMRQWYFASCNGHIFFYSGHSIAVSTFASVLQTVPADAGCRGSRPSGRSERNWAAGVC